MDLRVAAYAVITDDDGRILLAHGRQGRRTAWTLPGGGLESGEDPENAVRREVREETGYRVRVDELLGIHSRVIPEGRRVHRDTGAPLHALRIVYRAAITGGRLRDEVGGTTDRAEWFTVAAARSLRRVRLIDIGLKMAGLRA
ncbi:NUDIX domain-containing protein [Microbacterium sp. LRZ72]|uniref:NUDIX hydrolase n=1 Tax=Microbacterium sp. LRZ72 TaxID=2942481 RepID=UPI0029BECAA9|nr:NUDIX domain-containing protein [Microbacterium sp. LRZ72]MDX2376244.1 NUDIX domain-containing protein [Microbacterium sp. LRZ72]